MAISQLRLGADLTCSKTGTNNAMSRGAYRHYQPYPPEPLAKGGEAYGKNYVQAYEGVKETGSKDG